MVHVADFLNDESGATAIEYGLIAALVSIAAVVAFGSTGETILEAFSGITEDFCVAIGGNFTLSNDGLDSCS
ncbi:Flp family type IVb pilin [Sneathiella sp. CAU 1612]|uniref:Flp family type IVb pilin n=1 Tax=Sneathiella sedimenti TaxID=2816034 RepID=A0ABS3F551_9PROT|nr:Flp family type IVb pilin [Sneathiella sedimenti]MBO0333659.1 Flp family type IVb pilin [Sneathiella sedimenti]